MGSSIGPGGGGDLKAPDGGGYFIVQGLVGADRAAEILPEFRRVTESFRRTDD